jgi:hypothetical protein
VLPNKQTRLPLLTLFSALSKKKGRTEVRFASAARVLSDVAEG